MQGGTAQSGILEKVGRLLNQGKAPNPLGKAGCRVLDGSGFLGGLSPIVEHTKHDGDTQAKMDPDNDLFI